jgi:hypothetical protein
MGGGVIESKETSETRNPSPRTQSAHRRRKKEERRKKKEEIEE